LKIVDFEKLSRLIFEVKGHAAGTVANCTIVLYELKPK
jgi:hypothetical protein